MPFGTEEAGAVVPQARLEDSCLGRRLPCPRRPLMISLAAGAVQLTVRWRSGGWSLLTSFLFDGSVSCVSLPWT